MKFHKKRVEWSNYLLDDNFQGTLVFSMDLKQQCDIEGVKSVVW